MNLPNAHPSRLSCNLLGRDRAVAFIVVRLSSSRLPRKQFRLIGDRPMLQWIVDHLKACDELDDIVIATVGEKENEPLREFAREQGHPCFWYEGKVDHVTTRLRKAAEEFMADICVLVSGDCPLIHAPSIDRLIEEARQHPDADVILAKEDDEGNLPVLEGIGIARIKAWQLADDLSDRPELKEHQFPIISKRPDLFKTQACRLKESLYVPFRHRYSVDTWSDLKFMNELYGELTAKGKAFEIPDVLDSLKRQPGLLDINSHVHQMSVGEERKTVLMVVDPGNVFGYGHLMRCRELAIQITERLGWSVAFLVKDKQAKQILRETGIRTINESQNSQIEIQGIAEGDGAQTFRLPSSVSLFDLIILDINLRHLFKNGWRQRIPGNCKVVVLDNLANWTKEADLVIASEVSSIESNSFKISVENKIPKMVKEIATLFDREEMEEFDGYEYKSGPS